MSDRAPVFCNHRTAAREEVKDRINGRLLAQTATTEDFAAAITDAAAGTGMLANWHEEALRTAMFFSRQSCVRRLEEVYREALSPQAKGSAATLDAWEAILESLQAEWDLVTSKFGAVLEAVVHPADVAADLE